MFTTVSVKIYPIAWSSSKIFIQRNGKKTTWVEDGLLGNVWEILSKTLVRFLKTSPRYPSSYHRVINSEKVNLNNFLMKKGKGSINKLDLKQSFISIFFWFSNFRRSSVEKEMNWKFFVPFFTFVPVWLRLLKKSGSFLVFSGYRLQER